MSDLLVVLFGLGVGISVGLTGVGGGSFLTPFLILVLRVHPAVAVATSLVFTLVTRAVGSVQHLRQHTVDLKVVRQLAIGSVPAAIATSFVLRGSGSLPLRSLTRPRDPRLPLRSSSLVDKLLPPASTCPLRSRSSPDSVGTMPPTWTSGSCRTFRSGTGGKKSFVRGVPDRTNASGGVVAARNRS